MSLISSFGKSMKVLSKFLINRTLVLYSEKAVSATPLGLKCETRCGKQVYEFIRLNPYGSIPNLATVGHLIKNSDTAFSEAEFRFQSLRRFHLHFGFCSEDTAGVIREVEYDSKTNSFVGFATPIDHGAPLSQFYRADTFNDLKTIYDTNEIAPVLNVQMLQTIPTEDDAQCISRPLLVPAYGDDNRITAISVLNRWVYIFSTLIRKKCSHHRFFHR
ncbi:unnamed protein product [Rotaria socialis]|uniref:Uncharacterized protein n=1 Tax=Rotaria socialis TaxID=392032 RepID=A0A818Q6H0_9BILA|nr:unnamed protein product [Rotaria socialis]